MLSFEQAIKKLEDASDKLRSGDLSLEESVKLYEKCVEYYKQCNTILAESKQKIEIFNPETNKLENLEDLC